jgi:hypothetical protein
MRGDGGGSGTGDGGGAAGTVARWRGEADGEAAWWSGLRGSVVQKHVVWEADDEESRGRGTGERRPDPTGGVRSPGEKPRIGFAEPVEVGFQTATNLAMGRNCRGVPSRGKLEDLGFPNEPLEYTRM